MNLNERLIAISVQMQERQQEAAKVTAESIRNKQIEIIKKQDELKDVLENIKYLQQLILNSFEDKEKLFTELQTMIEEVNIEENKAKRKTLVSQLYPDLDLNTLKIDDNEDFRELLDNASLTDFIGKLMEFKNELEIEYRNNQ
jgi:tRNA G10  N-methylase Trm11